MRASHRLEPRRVVRLEDGVQYRRLYFWTLMLKRAEHLFSGFFRPMPNANAYFTYENQYAEFYRPVVVPLEPVISTLAGSFMPMDKEANEKLSFLLPFCLFCLMPTALVNLMMLLRCLERFSRWRRCRSHCLYRYCGCPRRLRCLFFSCCRSALIQGRSSPRPRREKGRNRRFPCKLACRCATILATAAIPMASCVGVFLAPVLFSDYTDDLVPSDHRLLVATFHFS